MICEPTPCFRSNGQRSQQCTDILSSLQRPERLQNRIDFLARPALADIAAEFAVDIRPLHRLTREAGNVVDLAGDALPIRQNRGDAGWYGVADARGELRIFHDRNLLHEGEAARFRQLSRYVGDIGDVAVE